MADIDVQRKGGMGWLWWVLGLLLLALIVWWIAAAGDDDDAEVAVVDPAPVVTPTTTPEVVAGATGITLADIMGNPAAYVGQSFSDDEVRVAEVPTDRGFWIEDEGQRIFAILNDNPQEEPLDINPGQTLRVQQAMLRAPATLNEVPGQLDADTRRIAEGQPIFLVVEETNINILTQGTPQPGTDPAQTAGTAPR